MAMATSGIRQRSPKSLAGDKASGGSGSKPLLGKRQVILAGSGGEEPVESNLDGMLTTVKFCRYCGAEIHLESLTPDTPHDQLPVVFPEQHLFACNWGCHLGHRQTDVVSREAAFATV